MLWYILWFTVLELFALVIVLSFILLRYKDSSLKYVKEQRFVLQPIKLFVWALITIGVFNVSFVFRLNWHKVVVGLVLVLIFIVLLIVYKLYQLANVRFIIKKFLLQYLEGVFIGLLVFTILTFLRGLTPDLISTEKPMDFSFIQSFVRQDNIPFINPWLADVLLNYYYMGQFWIAILAYLSPFSVATVYNLAVGLIATYAFQVVYEFYVYYIKGIRKLAIIFTAGILFGGNPGYLIYILKSIIKSSYSYYYPDSTRIIPKTINEFPAYSVLLADLHGHYLMLPFVWATAILIVIFVLKLTSFVKLAIQEAENRINSGGRTLDYVITKDLLDLALILLMLGFLVPFILAGNSWDIINLLLLTLILIAVSFSWYIVRHKKAVKKVLSLPISYIIKMFVHIIEKNYKVILLFIFSCIVLVVNSIPFLVLYIPPGGGIKFIHNPRFDDFVYYFLLWGHVVFVAILAAFLGDLNYRKTVKIFKKNYIKHFLVLLLVGMFGTGVLLVLLTQFVYVQDIFDTVNHDYFRANTVFKVFYTAWFFMLFPLFGLILEFLENMPISKRIDKFSINNINKNALKIILIIVFILLGYFVVGVEQRFLQGGVRNLIIKASNSLSFDYLDGLVHYNAWFNSEDLKVLNYLKHLKFSTNIIVEPVTYTSYSSNAKYCIYSGGQCFIGWPLHNMQWYGGWKGKARTGVLKKDIISLYNDIHIVDIQQRVALLSTIYSDTNTSMQNALSNLVYNYKTDNRAIHFLVYKTDMIYDPHRKAADICSILQSRKLCKNLYMIHTGQVYDIVCK